MHIVLLNNLSLSPKMSIQVTRRTTTVYEFESADLGHKQAKVYPGRSHIDRTMSIPIDVVRAEIASYNLGSLRSDLVVVTKEGFYVKALHTAQDTASSFVESAKHLPESPIVKRMIGSLVAANDYVLDKMADVGSAISRGGTVVGGAVAEKAKVAGKSASASLSVAADSAALTLNAAKDQAVVSLHHMEDVAAVKLEEVKLVAAEKFAVAKSEASIKLAQAQVSAQQSLTHAKEQASIVLHDTAVMAQEHFEHAKSAAYVKLGEAKIVASDKLDQAKVVGAEKLAQAKIVASEKLGQASVQAKGAFIDAKATTIDTLSHSKQSIQETLSSAFASPSSESVKKSATIAQARHLPRRQRFSTQYTFAFGRNSPREVGEAELMANQATSQSMKLSSSLQQEEFSGVEGILSAFAGKNAAFGAHPGRYLPGSYNVAEFHSQRVMPISQRFTAQRKFESEALLSVNRHYVAPSRRSVSDKFSMAISALQNMLVIHPQAAGRYIPNSLSVAESMCTPIRRTRNRSSNKVHARFPQASSSLHQLSAKHAFAFPGRYAPASAHIAEQASSQMSMASAQVVRSDAVPSGHVDLINGGEMVAPVGRRLSIDASAPMDAFRDEYKPREQQIRAPLHGDFSNVISQDMASLDSTAKFATPILPNIQFSHPAATPNTRAA